MEEQKKQLLDMIDNILNGKGVIFAVQKTSSTDDGFYTNEATVINGLTPEELAIAIDEIREGTIEEHPEVGLFMAMNALNSLSDRRKETDETGFNDLFNNLMKGNKDFGSAE